MVAGALWRPDGKRDRQAADPDWEGRQNETAHRLVLDLLAQRISGVVEEVPQTFAMQRGHEDEIEAKLLYAQNIAPVEEIGFMIEDRFGFTLGYSPDGLVGQEGLLECKSRAHGLQLGVICGGEIPVEYMAQIQTGLLVSGHKWLDFISFPAMGGAKMMICRVYPDPVKLSRRNDPRAQELQNAAAQRAEELTQAAPEDADDMVPA